MVPSVPPNSSVALSNVGRDGCSGSHDLIGNRFQWCRYCQGELDGQSRGVEGLAVGDEAWLGRVGHDHLRVVFLLQGLGAVDVKSWGSRPRLISVAPSGLVSIPIPILVPRAADRILPPLRGWVVVGRRILGLTPQANFCRPFGARVVCHLERGRSTAESKDPHRESREPAGRGSLRSRAARSVGMTGSSSAMSGADSDAGT